MGCTSFSNETGNRSTHLKWNTPPTAFIKLSSLNYYSRSNEDMNCNFVFIHILLRRNSFNSFQYPFRHYPSKMAPLCLRMHVTWYCCCFHWIACWNERGNEEGHLRNKTIRSVSAVNGSRGSCNVAIDSHVAESVIDTCVRSVKTAVECHWLQVFSLGCVPCHTDPVELTMRRWPPPLQRLLLESNGAVNCQPITQLFPLCWAGCRVILVPWPVTSGEWVKCSVWGRQCQPASHVQPERPSLPASLPEDWASSMHQWHQPSQGTCSMPNQWFIRTQLAGRHGASCHMPRGSTAICTHTLLL